MIGDAEDRIIARLRAEEITDVVCHVDEVWQARVLMLGHGRAPVVYGETSPIDVSSSRDILRVSVPAGKVRRTLGRDSPGTERRRSVVSRSPSTILRFTNSVK